MNKFDSILQEYVNKVTFNPQALGDALNKMSIPPQEKAGLAATAGAIASAENPDKLHSKLADILNPETKTNFSSLSPKEQEDAIKRMLEVGFPLTNQSNNDVANDQNKKTPDIASSTSSKDSTNYGSGSKNQSAVQGGQIQG